jgi:hypothetical protein
MIRAAAEAALDIGVADPSIGDPNEDPFRSRSFRDRDICELKNLVLFE